MSTQSVVEKIRCPKCDSIVPRQANCPKCGQILNIAQPISQETARLRELKEIAKQGLLNQPPKLKKPLPESVKSDSPKDVENVAPQVEKIMPQKVETSGTNVDKVITRQEPSTQNIPIKSYTPDLYAKQIIEKMAKQVKYEINLVQLFKEGQVPEEIFTRLFNGITDEVSSLIARRAEVTKELTSLMNEYNSTVLSAQQGMKLLDLRKSLDDVTDEEYKIKAAALNWDIKHYGERILEGQLKADYLRSLGSLIPVEDVNDLKKIATDNMDPSSMKHVEDGAREKITQAMGEASSILNEIYNS